MIIFKYTRIAITLMLASLLCGCATQQRQVATGNYRASQENAAMQANNFMAMAQQSTGHAASMYKLRAVEQLILAEKLEDAEMVFNQEAKTKLSGDDAAYKHIVGAQLYLAKRDITAAKNNLSAIWTPLQLPENLQIKFFTTRAEVYRRSGSLIEATQERIYLSRFIKNEDARKENNKIIWAMLSDLTPDTLKALQNPDSADEFNGWVYFANITKQYDVSEQNKARALALWKTKFPKHPAQSFIPTDLREFRAEDEISIAAGPSAEQEVTRRANIKKTAINTPKKIAILLPLHGQHAQSAQAIRDGFMTAFYAHKGTGKPKIRLYDTTKSNLKAIYQQAINDGANFIVGPLIKEEVESIIETANSDVPILTLNNVNKETNNSNLFQFGLSPEMEAVAVAEKAWRDGHRNALIIATKSAWGKRMQSTFEDAWTARGGKVLGVAQVVGSPKELNSQIQQLLAIDASEERANNLKALGLKFSFEPRRRQDPNMIFIATNANLARQLKPLLNFYYAANLPAYAGSSVYEGKPTANLDQDLNGVQFCDMPWVLDNSMNTRASYKLVTEAWPREFEQYPRLFALGIDAYKIAVQLEQVKMLPELGISGMTGMLTLDGHNKFQRKLMWASFKRGVPFLSGEKM